MREPRVEYIVLHAPGWPGGLKPVPNTLDTAKEFVEDHGGVVYKRWVSEWEIVILNA